MAGIESASGPLIMAVVGGHYGEIDTHLCWIADQWNPKNSGDGPEFGPHAANNICVGGQSQDYPFNFLCVCSDKSVAQDVEVTMRLVVYGKWTFLLNRQPSG